MFERRFRSGHTQHRQQHRSNAGTIIIIIIIIIRISGAERVRTGRCFHFA
ncbi:hypothetical protein [Arthrobacter sp. YAF16]